MTTTFASHVAARGFAVLALTAAVVLPARAQDAAQVSIGYANQRFEPAEASAPADRPLVIHVRNGGAKAIEFESKSLRVEKVIAPGTEGVMNIRALKPGRYEYFDDFDHAVRGALVVK
ncbi:MAG: cupredoxin domain-containing protein [Xanthobacteraceae bacterium]|nr:cupredoxin domain-containing protein [Xanthobacteraceae bacterium]